MDYEQHLYGRPAYDPSRRGRPLQRNGGAGGMLLVIAVILAALLLVIWMASSRDSGVAILTDTGAAATDATAPATDVPATDQ